MLSISCLLTSKRKSECRTVIQTGIELFLSICLYLTFFYLLTTFLFPLRNIVTMLLDPIKISGIQKLIDQVFDLWQRREWKYLVRKDKDGPERKGQSLAFSYRSERRCQRRLDLRREAFFDDRFSVDLPGKGAQLPGIFHMTVLSEDCLRLLDDRTGMS